MMSLMSRGSVLCCVLRRCMCGMCRYLADHPLYPYAVSGTGKHKDHFKVTSASSIRTIQGPNIIHLN
jgi:hypothetical protein